MPVVDTVPTGLPASYGQYLRYTVWIRNDEVEAISRGADDDDDKRVIIRSEGIARDGVSFFAIEAGVIIVASMLGDQGYGTQSGGDSAGSNAQVGTLIPGP